MKFIIFTTSSISAAVATYFYSFFIALALVPNVYAATEEQWRGRAIYQIITDRFSQSDGSTNIECVPANKLICGGTWRGIIKQLDYIQGMGFTAIWISPIVKNIDGNAASGQAYHGFWQSDITQLNPNMGTDADLKAMVKACHDRDIYVMIDVVANNFAYAGPGQNTDFTQFVPFNKAEYFHPFCYVTDYSNDTNAQQCWLGDDIVSLPDMYTELPFVQQTWNTWAVNTVANYGFDGLRIDATKHVAKPFWTSFQNTVGVYMVGEVYEAVPEYTCPYMVNALDAVLNFPMWYSIINTFTKTTESMLGLTYEYNDIYNKCSDTTLMGTFTENQDVARFASFTSDLSQQKNALAWALMGDGIPIVYYGAEQGFNSTIDPENREPLWTSGYDTTAPLYKFVGAVNSARNRIQALSTGAYWSSYWTYKTKIVLADDNVLGIRKGYDTSLLTILTNKGVNAPKLGPYTVGDTNFIEGDLLVEVIGCTTMTAGRYGVVSVSLPAGGTPQVWIAARHLVGTTVCPSITKGYTPPKVIQNNAPQGAQTRGSLFALLALVMAALTLL